MAGTSNEVATTNESQVAPTNHGAYITKILEETKRGFIEANAGLDMDFVYMGDWLTINKKGAFVERDDEEANYGDSIDVVIGHGEKRYSLWGNEKSPEEGQLIVAEPELEAAQEKLTNWLGENPDAEESYSLDDIELRYMAMVVPVDSLTDVAAGDFPKVYLMSFPKTTTIAYGKWAMRVYQGKYKHQGVPAGNGVNKIVTRLTTVEKEGKNNQSWVAIEFSAVGMFDPADYGIKPE